MTVGGRKEVDGMRQDDRGITLVEIIISIAAAAIVIGVTTIFIQNALKSYNIATDTIDLQMDAQVLMEQLATWVMEGNYVDPNAEVGGKKVCIIYNIPREPSTSLPTGSDPDLMGKRWMRVIWRNDEGELYTVYKEHAGAVIVPDPLDTTTVPVTSSELTEIKDNLLSNHVEEFKMERPDDDSGSPNKVTVTLSMKAGVQDYEFTNEINMRNALYSEPETTDEDPESGVPSPEEP